MRLDEQRKVRTLNLPRRTVLLGGTTTYRDCAVAAGLLARPGALLNGPYVADYEREFASRLGVGRAFSFASGRVGLYGLLQAMGVGPGDEVLLQVPTHIVVANAVRYVGARPVFVDCSLDNYNMDFEEAERKISPRTKVLLVQHTFGIPADMDIALDIGRRHNIDVLEDCVHALGATYEGRPVGSFGRAAFYSTEETKTITSVMGGMATTDEEELARRLEEFQSRCSLPDARVVALYVLKFILFHALTEPHLYPYSRKLYEWTGEHQLAPEAVSEDEMEGKLPAGYEQRLSNAQALLAMRQLRRLDENVSHRRDVARQYVNALSPLGFRPPSVPEKADAAMIRYPVWVPDRALALEAALPGIEFGKWFSSVLEEAVSPTHGGYEMGSCPRAELAARHLVNLPTHERVSELDVERIRRVLAGLSGEGNGSS